MRHYVAVILCFGISVGAACAQKPSTSWTSKEKNPYFIHLDRLPLLDLIPAPPAAGSVTTEHEFQQLHAIEQTRTPQEVKLAQADDAEEDIFIFRNVIGPRFEASLLPLTSELSAHVHNDEPVAGNPIKQAYSRPRPYQIDSTLHPVCKTTTQHNAYPSGHTVSGYLLALTLIEIVPEKRDEILSRAREYAHNRLVCGVHTASDIEASELLAYMVFGSLLQEPKFQQELSAARAEARHVLQLDK